jgi:hypothetical protein
LRVRGGLSGGLDAAVGWTCMVREGVQRGYCVWRWSRWIS